MAKVTVLLLAVDRLLGASLCKPRLITSHVIDTADNILGARDIIPVAFADLKEHEYLVLSRVSVAVERGWIEKNATLGAKKREDDVVGPPDEDEEPARLFGKTWSPVKRTGTPAPVNREPGRPTNPFEE